MTCKECSARIVWSPKYGDMRKIKKFMLCSYNEKLKLNPNSNPKWCPYKHISGKGEIWQN